MLELFTLFAIYVFSSTHWQDVEVTVEDIDAEEAAATAAPATQVFYTL